MRTWVAIVVAMVLAGCGGGGSSSNETAQADIPWDDVNWEQIIDDVKPIEWCLEQDAYGTWWKTPCER